MRRAGRSVLLVGLLLLPVSPAAAGSESVEFELEDAQQGGPGNKDAWAAMARNRWSRRSVPAGASVSTRSS